MVDWLELSRGVKIDFLKLVVTWYAEWSRVRAGKGGSDCSHSASFLEESAKHCLQQLASSLHCEKEKISSRVTWKSADSRGVGNFSGLGSFWAASWSESQSLWSRSCSLPIRSLALPLTFRLAGL